MNVRHVTLSLVASALCLSSAALAQTAAAPLPCDGSPARIRFSTIKPDKMPLFEKAIKDHNTWYANHGSTSHSVLLKVVHYDKATNTPSYAADEAGTLTVYSDKPDTAPRSGADWDAFVAEYDASSTIKTEQRVCLPHITN